jgi:hypothetical protein
MIRFLAKRTALVSSEMEDLDALLNKKRPESMYANIRGDSKSPILLSQTNLKKEGSFSSLGDEFEVNNDVAEVILRIRHKMSEEDAKFDNYVFEYTHEVVDDAMYNFEVLELVDEQYEEEPPNLKELKINSVIVMLGSNSGPNGSFLVHRINNAINEAHAKHDAVYPFYIDFNKEQISYRVVRVVVDATINSIFQLEISRIHKAHKIIMDLNLSKFSAIEKTEKIRITMAGLYALEVEKAKDFMETVSSTARMKSDILFKVEAGIPGMFYKLAQEVSDKYTSPTFLLAHGKLPRLLTITVRLLKGKGTVSFICNLVLVEPFREKGLLAKSISINTQVYTRHLIQCLYLARKAQDATAIDAALRDMREYLHISAIWIDEVSVKMLRSLLGNTN